METISPFVISVYGVLGRGDLVVLSQLSGFMAVKRDEPLIKYGGG